MSLKPVACGYFTSYLKHDGEQTSISSLYTQGFSLSRLFHQQS